MISVKYHKIFNFDLVSSDFPKWKYSTDKSIRGVTSIKSITRKRREQTSREKLIIAKKASRILSKIPTIKFVGITGSLAMFNCKKDSDIDLMIVTKSGTLWMTRLICLILFFNKIRRAKNNNEKDKLCFNLWLDETDIVWDKKDRNIYTAHEIAQVVPLVNKDKTYEKFLWQNRWILNFWPFAVKILRCKTNHFISIPSISLFIEKFCFWVQLKYMKSKMTREVASATRAIFHPNDWGKVVMEKLKN